MKKPLFICYPRCTTCKKAQEWLNANGIDAEVRDIKTANPTAKEIAAWQKMNGLPTKKFFNTGGASYRDMGLKDKIPDMTDEEQRKLLATDGMLVKRPLLIGDNFALVGFKENEWAEKLTGKAPTAKKSGKKTASGKVTAFVMKITLKRIKPPVWRKFVVPKNMTFQKFSAVLEMIMGWTGFHMAAFQMPTSGINIVCGAGCDFAPEAASIADKEFGELDGKKTKLSEFLPDETKFGFVYDLGDYWEHRVVIEKIIDDYEFNYPQVLSYNGNCPPEDGGDARLLEDMRENPDDYDEEDFEEFEYDLAEVNEYLKDFKTRR